MTLVVGLVQLILGILLLLWGADWFIDGVRDLARYLGMSALVLGVILAGLEPEEMLTSALASGRGLGALATGNVIGTNVTIVTLALGLSALITPILLRREIRRQALIATAASIPPIILLLLGPISRIEGVLLLLLFAGYTIVLLRTDQKGVQNLTSLEMLEDDDDDDDDEPSNYSRQMQRWHLLALTIIGLLAMAIGGSFIVDGAHQLISSTGLGEGVIGATIVSLGTGAEMIALGMTAARKRQTDVLVGGILGSFAYNLMVTLGLAAVVRPLPAIAQHLQIAIWIMIVTHLVLLLLIWRGKMGRTIGVLFILAYIAYCIIVVAL